MNLHPDLFSQKHVPERSWRRGVVVHELSIIIFPCEIFPSTYELYKKSFRMGLGLEILSNPDLDVKITST